MSNNSYIKQKPPTNATYTHNIQYPSAILNPTDRKVITRNLCVDTLFRKNYDKTISSNFLHTLPDPITNVISMKISAVEFPNAWFNFTSENQSNEFTITLYNTPPFNNKAYMPVMRHKIIIPNGNYMSGLFNVSMNNLLKNIGNGLEYIYFEVNELNTHCIFRTKTASDDTQWIDVGGNNVNSHLVEESVKKSVNPFYFTIDFRIESDPNRPLYRNAGWMMGFKQPFYEVRYLKDSDAHTDILHADGPQTYNWFLKSESSYGSSIHNYLFLEIDDFNKNFSTNTLFSNTVNETYLGNNIMGRISVVSGMNTIITNSASDRIFKKREYFGPVKLEKIHVRLINRFGDPVLFNGNDFSFVLEIEQLYS